jgi:microcystin-dependent protein
MLYHPSFGEKSMRLQRMMVLVFSLLFLAPCANAQVGSTPWVGEVLLVPYNFAPTGYALCNGQILPIASNTALFSLLGTQFGGDGKTNFALPDLRGRSPIGSGQGPGLSSYVVGQMGGEEQVTLTVSQMPSHTHTVKAASSLANQSAAGGNAWAAQSLLQIYSSSAGSSMAPGAVSTAGGGQPHDNLSPYLTLNYIIALEGIYPSRD